MHERAGPPHRLPKLAHYVPSMVMKADDQAAIERAERVYCRQCDQRGQLPARIPVSPSTSKPVDGEKSDDLSSARSIRHKRVLAARARSEARREAEGSLCPNCHGYGWVYLTLRGGHPLVTVPEMAERYDAKMHWLEP